MEFVAEIKSVSPQECFKPVQIINEKYGVSVTFLAEFSEKEFAQSGCLRGKRHIWKFSGAGSIAAYSQYCSSLIRITLSGSAI